MQTYSARTSYLTDPVAEHYETDRFSSALGRYRLRRERSGVGAVLAELPGGLSVLDCPAGTGRWFPLLSQHAAELTAADLSAAMLGRARRRSETAGVDVGLVIGEAEHLPFPDGRFDLVFSHALTKHLPTSVQHRVLAEFGRVTRRWVVCSFGIVGPVTYALWRRRGLVESYPVLVEQLDRMATEARLARRRTVRCTTPAGVEHSVLFERVESVRG